VVLAGSLGAGVLFLLVLRLAASTLGLGRRAWVLAGQALSALGLAFLANEGLRRLGPSLESVPGSLARIAIPAALTLGVAGALLRGRTEPAGAGEGR
jgi:hypothetical protein